MITGERLWRAERLVGIYAIVTNVLSAVVAAYRGDAFAFGLALTVGAIAWTCLIFLHDYHRRRR